jgi:hypothetical protein
MAEGSRVVISIGVDPGKLGAVVAIDDQRRLVFVEPMPLVKSSRARDEYDLPAVVDLLTVHEREAVFVTVERLQPLPSKLGGGIANYARGFAQGWVWMLTALRIPFQLVPPAMWQRAMLIGTPGNDTKQRAILAAQRLFPYVELRRFPKHHRDGVADALLLAEYGRRGRNGG